MVKAGLGLAERKALVERGISGRVHDERESRKEAQVVITRTQPLEVMVTFDRYQVGRSGEASELGHVFLGAHLKEVPRSPENHSRVPGLGPNATVLLRSTRAIRSSSC